MEYLNKKWWNLRVIVSVLFISISRGGGNYDKDGMKTD